jgi:hypothetical protein
MVPSWLTALASISLVLAFASAALILNDIFVRGYRQRMRIMEAVWPVTALYFGPFASLGYRRWGRPNSPAWHEATGADPDYGERASTAIGVSHCGAGCTLGDIIGAWLVFVLGWQLFGAALPAEYVVDFTLAFTIGIVFQYFAIAPMRGVGLGRGVVAALKADTLSLAAFEVGLFGWMAFMQLVLFTHPHLTPDHTAYWFLMQFGMVLGFMTAYPVNVWLIRRGIKEAM